MAIVNRNTLKSWFERGNKPLASQFADWIDSFWHKWEHIPAAQVDGLQEALDGKANSDALASEILNRNEVDNEMTNMLETLSIEVGRLQNITVIRGNVDTYAQLLGISTTDMRTGDSYIVETDENHEDNSAIYTWDGEQWTFTHIWDVNFNLIYGTYTVSSATFTFAQFANNNSERFDVLEVSFAAGINNYTVGIAAPTPGNHGDIRMMIFNVGANQKVTLSFGFAHKLVEGAELTLSSGVHVVTLLRASTNIINIAPYE